MDEFTKRQQYVGDPMPGDPVVAERRKLNWSAIFAGVVATLGLQVFLVTMGSALGLSAFDPVEVLRSDSNMISTGMIIFLAISTLASAFFGSWIAGHWANLFDAEDAYIHGALCWALSLVAVAAGIGGLASITGEMSQAGAMARAATASTAVQGASPENFSVLNDDRFAAMIATRARTWSNARDPINVSAEKSKEAAAKVDPDDVVSDAELRSFVMTNGNMTDDQAKEFLKANKDTIAQSQAESKKLWEQQHAKELAQADKLRKCASIMAWTMTGLALLALGASIGGSYLGWTQHYHRGTRHTMPSEEAAGNRPL